MSGQIVASLLRLFMTKWLRKWRRGWHNVRSNTKKRKVSIVWVTTFKNETATHTASSVRPWRVMQLKVQRRSLRKIEFYFNSFLFILFHLVTFWTQSFESGKTKTSQIMICLAFDRHFTISPYIELTKGIQNVNATST